MLNYETLLSSYDDKLTLMQWLKKVEKALAGASASSFEVIKTGNATIRFRINFEDGTYLESGDIVLQQGESVASGEIRNGHLYLTLTNGQELDCGELFNGEVPSLEVRSLEVTGGLIVGNDANVTIGGDLVVHGLTEVQNILAYGHVETETLTAAGDKINAEKPVVEVMTGYSADAVTPPNLTIENIYAGIVKNGNKLTFVYYAKLTRTDTISGNTNIIAFNIPAAVGAKLYPVQFGLYQALNVFYVEAFSDFSSSIKLPCYMEKYNNTRLVLTASSLSGLVQGTTYTIRVEQTFLLSENLAA